MHIRTQSDRDWLDLIADCLSRPLREMPAARIALALAATFDCVGVAYHIRATGALPQQSVWPAQPPAPISEEEIIHYSRYLAPTRHPNLRYYTLTGDRVARQIRQVPSRIAPPRLLEEWVHYTRPLGVPNQLSIPVSPQATHRTFVMGRWDTFSPGEELLAQRLQRLLSGLDTQVRLIESLPVTTNELQQALGLTPRQTAVVVLMAQGLTAAAAARRLGVSERTIHAHTRRIYARLGVNDRVSAILRARQAGII